MRQHRWYTPWLLVAPAVLWTLVFALYPFLNTIILSFTNARPLRGGTFVGLANYQELFADPQFLSTLQVTFVYVLGCVPLLTLLPLGLALLMQHALPGLSFFRTVAYFPVIASVVAVALIWQWMFESRGIINQAVQYLGLTDEPVPFLVDRWSVVAVAIALTVWRGLGYYMVVYLAALANVEPELHEAAALDGAGAFRRFLNVTIPGVRGAMLLIMALISVSAMRIFSELYMMTNGTGGPGGESSSIVMLIKQVGSGLTGRLGYASAISVVLFFLTLVPLAFIGWVNQAGAGNIKRRKGKATTRTQTTGAAVGR
ncbi:carbohydrate ABC transporter permease [uncultured Tessaracoccus sp.]|uniref:carbohydrate ABC transporter permease n=1 Tax=uncultured Tessaracoccus sp. TaxID=905023 RepID=UPI00345B4ECD